MPGSDVAVAAAFVAVVVDEELDDAVSCTLRWALHVWAAGCDEAPLWLIHDLGFVLLRGRSARFKAHPHDDNAADDDDGLRAARLAFGDRVVALWLQDPAILSAHVIIAGLPAATQEHALTHALVAALTRGLPPGSFGAGSVGALRSLQPRLAGAEHFVDADDVVRRASPEALKNVAGRLHTAKLLLADKRLLFDEDLWELSHLQDLPSEAARLALRIVHQTQAQIGAPSFAVLSLLVRRSRDVLVDDEDDNAAFPAGGFDAMSTQGTFENLVRSEVAYVGEGQVDGQGPDLFDLRFVEGELLYYTRDESPLLQQRRSLCFVIDDVDRLRFKPLSLPTQTLVLVLACCLRAHADLLAALGPLALHTTFALSGQNQAIVDEERGLLATSLMAEIAHHRVSLLENAQTLPLHSRRKRVVFSPLSAPGAMKRGSAKERPARLWVQVGGPQWIVDDGLDDSSVVDASSSSALRAFVDRLLLLA